MHTLLFRFVAPGCYDWLYQYHQHGSSAISIHRSPVSNLTSCPLLDAYELLTVCAVATTIEILDTLLKLI
jgi:hypothetical protein